MASDLIEAGKQFWNEISEDTDPPRDGPVSLFAPDFCDLHVEIQRINTKPPSGKQPETSEPLEEIVQHLRDLGYLKSKILKAEDEPVLEDALIRYYADQDQFDDFFSYQQADKESGEPMNVYRDKILEEQIKQPLVVKFDTISRLRALTTFDGKLTLRNLPAEGETSLRTRTIHYLLRVYGVLPKSFPIDSAYGPETLRALRGVRALRGIKASDITLLEIINDLSNIEKVASQLAEQFKDKLLLIPRSEHDQIKAMKNLPEDLPTKALDIRNLPDEPLKNWNWNIFATRFLQAYLWHRGHYLGEIDGLWGPLSERAFVSALSAHGLPEKEGKGRFWLKTKQNYAIDLSLFIYNIQEIFPTGEKVPETSEEKTVVIPESPYSPDDLLELRNSIDEGLTNLYGANSKERGVKEETLWERVLDHLKDPDKQQKADHRRKNYAVNMIGRGIDRFKQRLAKAVDEIKEKAKKGIEKFRDFTNAVLNSITGSVLQAFRFLMRGMEKILHTAKLACRRAIRFIRGTPFTNTPAANRWLMTKFRFDQDGITLSAPAATSEDIREHFDRIAEENRALEVSLIVGVKVIKIAAMVSNPTLGGYAAIKLALDVFEAVWEFFKKLQQPYKEQPAPWRTGMLMAT